MRRETSMDAQRKEEITEAWIAMSLAPQGSEAYESNFWAFNAIWDLCKEAPLDAWEVILCLTEKATSQKLLAAIGSGPLEDLMCDHGEKLIPLVEQEAVRNKKFLGVMGSVWLDANDTPVWRKFYEIAGIEPPFPEADA
jgi:hypothetical protein